MVDDEKNMRHMLRMILERERYQVTEAENGSDALALIAGTTFDFILCDVRMPEMTGMEFLDRAGAQLNETSVIMMSAYGTVDLAIESLKLGAYDFISKPFKTDEVILTLRKAEEREQLREENRTLKEEIRRVQGQDNRSEMVGESPRMRELFALADKISRYSTTVLITGESGTGKELLARRIHRRSPRARQPLCAINCGSIPESLMESELFGYQRGAFTGAEEEKRGLYAEADGGTLFLDEVGEMPLSMQVKLLRVLQEGEIRPVGAVQSRVVDVRVLAATSRDLVAAVAKGRFREDLYYRLRVMHLHIPPLRHRGNDVVPLCRAMLARLNEKLRMSVREVSPAALARLVTYPWPGNIRELENCLERAMILTDGEVIQEKDLPSAIRGFRSPADLPVDQEMSFSIKTAKIRVESGLIQQALDTAGGNKSRAAELLELSYPSLLSKIKLYGLE